MCGICGELRLDGQPAQPETVKRMLPALVRRGPDFENHWSNEQIALGHRRLAIIDLSERSNQPLVDRELGMVLVFNGAIYNYRELRAEFIREGYSFSSDGDSEVILKAYHKWGERCPEYLHGMFAFAIWDLNHRTLFLARDRMGIKPLYYSLDKHRLLFASNLQAILAAGGVDTDVDPVALHHQFTLHGVVPAPHTILKGVRKLVPGTSITFTHGESPRERRYWHLKARRPAQALSEAEWTGAIHDALRDAVRKRLDVADVPVGVLLSGGLDSSLLVALLAEAGVKDLRTFSIGFEDQPEEKGSEFEYSDQVVERYRTRHQKYHIPNEEVLPRLPEAVAQMAEPMFGQDAVAFYLLGERVSQEVKVVQSGQGADEVFAGYFWYGQMQQDTEGSDVERFARYYFDRPHSEFNEMVTESCRGTDVTSQTIAALLGKPQADEFIDRVLRMDVTTLIVDDPVKRVDNMTMAWGLEARVPFLDHQLVELAAQMPPELKLGNGPGGEGPKHILKRVARGLVPDSVIDRPKGYFPMPALKYVRGEFLDFMRELVNSDACRARGIYQREYVDKLLAAPDQHFTALRGSKLWHMALLELWFQIHVDPLKNG
ncbi:N-acetylglutaminylglutamine amidotransferase [Thiohalophilus sp.]|uniref:N-acetylglutaminylglutamine amidotransferase n=1 Tax=Thiohalophilus sp. TaxID=3028392 RepID=UPI002ACE0516|nr:N-acetylglutaminylglutamine amidotransferase [Thiohalophilus sp.]MDZ7802995.1 N-acetylglutaminylglutamine amidotransferase [Thiohalophilus sp.]